MNVKYEKEVRFAFSVALIRYLDEIVVGLRIPCFEYTEQTLLSLVDWGKKVKDEFLRVKTSSEKGWVVSLRGSRLFEQDDLLVLKNGLGNKLREKLHHHGATNLRDLFEHLRNPTLLQSIISIRGISARKAQTWSTILESSLHPGTCPPPTDHRSAANPYLSR